MTETFFLRVGLIGDRVVKVQAQSFEQAVAAAEDLFEDELRIRRPDISVERAQPIDMLMFDDSIVVHENAEPLDYTGYGYAVDDPSGRGPDTRPCPACSTPLLESETHWSLFPEPMGGYVCPVPNA